VPISAFFGLETALRGLLAQQRSLDVTGHNIANASTPGYSRQEAVLAAAPALVMPAGAVQDGSGAQIGAGVDVQAYRRVRDAFIDIQYRAQSMRLGDASTTARSLSNVELALAEPGDNGISALLGRFWNAWSDLANAPESPAARQAVVDAGAAIGNAVAELDSRMAGAQADGAGEYASLTSATGDVASAASDLASLNEAIRQATARGEAPNDLLDRRDTLLDKLASLGQVSTQDLGDGQLRVQFGDAALPLVDGSTVHWPQTLTAPGGKLGALLALASPSGPIASYRADLSAFAKNLADSVNARHPGTAFFSYTAGSEASTLAVAVTAATVRTTSGTASGGNDAALAIAALRGGAADGAYSALVARIGEGVRQAQRAESVGQVLVDALADRRESVAGVSLDEEMTNLVRFQRGYQASARALSAMDELLDDLINRTGRVGL
jgi:flagellar hook-associated protein 1